MTNQKSDFPSVSHAKKRAFLVAYSEVGTITHAAELAGITRRTVQNWKNSDPDFAAAMVEAEEKAAERLEQEARRRAVEGVAEPVYQGGKQVGTVRKYSDTLLIFLLKGAKPEKYRERVSQEISGPGGKPVQMQAVNLANLTDEELDQLETLTRKATLPAGDADTGADMG